MAIDRLTLKNEKPGAPLSERSPSGLTLTSAGALLFTNARERHKEYARTRELIAVMRVLQRGHVDIGLIDALNEGIVVEAVAALIPAIRLGGLCVLDHPFT